MNEPWRIEMFGTLQARQGDRVISRFKTQKTGTLLAFLALHPQRSCPREELIDLLWPEVPLEQGRPSLSVALSSLRQQLEPPGTPAGSVIAATQAAVRLNPGSFTTDVAEFEALLRTVGSADPLEPLMAAVDLYRGELLPGRYDDWVQVERERLTEAYIQALRQIVTRLAERKDLRRAIDYALRAVRADPLREELHRDVMLLHVRGGALSAALQQYRELERVLREETGAAPSAALRQLARDIEARAEQAISFPIPAPAAPAAAPVTQAAPSEQAPPPPATVTGVVPILLVRLPEDAGRQAAALERLKSACKAHGGTLKRREGEITAVFSRPSDAAACASALQGGRDGEDGTSAGLQCAFHLADTGNGDGGDSADFQRARGLLLAAHPGQVLCTEEAALRIRRLLEPGLSVAPLGPYRLQGGDAPEELFELRSAGWPGGGFPPPRAERARAANIPLTFNRFVGRAEELTRIESAVLEAAGDPAARRLLTLLGPGGAGKTRLAVEAARRLSEAFNGSVCFVGLSEARDAPQMVQAIHAALKLSPQPHVEPLDQVLEALSTRRSLLVLDNVEQLAGTAGPILRTLLERTPRLSCIATSRQLLGLPVEREHPIPPLPVPDGDSTTASPEQLVRCESVQLFVDRAQAARPDFQVTPHNAPSVAALCRQLEGIPLAIELAASRAQALTPAQMLERMREHGPALDLLSARRADTSERHRTLRNTIAWSYDLLPPHLQRFFRLLAVFRGGWSLEDVEAVSGEPLAMDWLAELRECSLVTTQEDPEQRSGMRFHMLEFLRAFAGEQTDEAERREWARRHAAWFSDMGARAAGPARDGDPAPDIAGQAASHENLRAALDWLLAEGESEPELAGRAARMCLDLADAWERQGRFHEARHACARALRPALTGSVEPVVIGRLHGVAGWFAHLQGDSVAAREHHEQSLALAEEAGDQEARMVALNNLALARQADGRLEEARALFEQSLEIARDLGDMPRQAARLSNLGMLLTALGDLAAAGERLREALRAYRRLGSAHGAAACLCNLGDLALSADDAEEARAYLEEALRLFREAADAAGEAHVLTNLAECLLREGDAAAASRAAREALEASVRLDLRALLPSLLETQARARALAGDRAAAAHSLLLAEALREEMGSPRSPREEALAQGTRETLGGELASAKAKSLRARLAAAPVRDLIGEITASLDLASAVAA